MTGHSDPPVNKTRTSGGLLLLIAFVIVLVLALLYVNATYFGQSYIIRLFGTVGGQQFANLVTEDELLSVLTSVLFYIVLFVLLYYISRRSTVTRGIPIVALLLIAAAYIGQQAGTVILALYSNESLATVYRFGLYFFLPLPESVAFAFIGTGALFAAGKKG